MLFTDAIYQALTSISDRGAVSATDVQSAFLHGVEEELRSRRDLHLSEKQREDAMFGVCAWFDETMFRLDPAWYGGCEPLQHQVFGTRQAGLEFFERLEGLGATDEPVRELYVGLLALGFRGKYVADEDLGRVRQMAAEQARQLTGPLLTPSTLPDGALTVQPYSIADPKPHPVWPSLLLRWVVVAIAIVMLVGVIGGLVVWLFSSRDYDGLNRRLSAIDCSHLVASGSLGIEVTGHVPEESRLQRVQAIVAQYTGNERPGLKEVEVIPRPLCEVLEVAWSQRDDKTHSGYLRVRSESDGPWVEGTPLRFSVELAGHEHYAVDYIQSDGQVVRLADGQTDSGRAEVGAEGEFAIGPPYGRDLLIFYGADSSLRVPPSKWGVASYLDMLREKLGEIDSFEFSYLVIDSESGTR